MYKNLVLQLNKDFKRANIDIDFIKDTSPSDLKLKLNNAIHNLILNTYSEYLNLLYIIDVSEEKIKKIGVDSTYEISKKIRVLSSITPKLYTYLILEEYPHDTNAYTQGLEFSKDTLYESTGQYKNSTLRKTDYKLSLIHI